MTYFTRRLQKRYFERQEIHDKRVQTVEHAYLSKVDMRPVLLMHASLLVGVVEPYLYPSLVPLMLLTTRFAYKSSGLEPAARDAFNLTWFYSMGFALISIVTLLFGVSDSPAQITSFHIPLVIAYVFLIARALFQTKILGHHHYPVPKQLLSATFESPLFMGEHRR